MSFRLSLPLSKAHYFMVLGIFLITTFSLYFKPIHSIFFYCRGVYYADIFRLITSTDHEYCLLFQFHTSLPSWSQAFQFERSTKFGFSWAEIFYENDIRNEKTHMKKNEFFITKKIVKGMLHILVGLMWLRLCQWLDLNKSWLAVVGLVAKIESQF